MFNYGETKKLKQITDRLEEVITDHAAVIIDQGKRLNEIQQAYASAATLRWAVGEIDRLEKRVKALEASTKPPAGLEPVKKQGGGSVAQRVLKALQEAGRPMRTKDIGEAVGTSSSHREALSSMAEKGQVVRLAYGHYVLPQAGYGGHASRYVEAATLQAARSVGQGQNGRG